MEKNKNVSHQYTAVCRFNSFIMLLSSNPGHYSCNPSEKSHTLDIMRKKYKVFVLCKEAIKLTITLCKSFFCKSVCNSFPPWILWESAIFVNNN